MGIILISSSLAAMEKNSVPTVPYERSLAYLHNQQDENHLITLGRQVLWKMRNDQYTPHSNLDNQLADLSKAYWAIYDAASQKIGFLFDKGSIKLIGPKNFKIYQNFLKYVLNANPNLTGTKADWRKPITFNKRADSRASTHYSSEYVHYGINLEFDSSFVAQLNKFPNNYNHLLFGIVDEQKKIFFLKPEEHGTHITETPGHALGLGKSIVRKKVLPFLERISPTLSKKIESITGQENDPLSRRETVNPAWLAKYTHIINSSDMKPEDKCKQISFFKKEGLQWAIAQVNNVTIANDLLKANPTMSQSMPEEHKKYLNGITYMAGIPHYPVNDVIDFILSASETHSEIVHRQGDEVILTDQYMDEYLTAALEK
jgi:hypothetical protein